MTAAADSCQHLQSSAAEVNTIFRPATEAKAGLGAVRHEEASTAGLENGVTQRSTVATAAEAGAGAAAGERRLVGAQG